jgi:hypothetical protein
MKKKRVICLMYRMLVGSLMYAMKWSELTILHAVGVVSGYMTNPGEAMKWVLQYCRGTGA